MMLTVSLMQGSQSKSWCCVLDSQFERGSEPPLLQFQIHLFVDYSDDEDELALICYRMV